MVFDYEVPLFTSLLSEPLTYQ